MTRTFNATADPRYGFQHDANFNTTSITDNSGVVIQRYVYDPYGSVTILNADGSLTTSTTLRDLLRYLSQGRRFGPATGLYDNLERIYDPTTGTFDQQDPWGTVNGVDLYQFVQGSPVCGLDPFGLANATGAEGEGLGASKVIADLYAKYQEAMAAMDWAQAAQRVQQIRDILMTLGMAEQEAKNWASKKQAEIQRKAAASAPPAPPAAPAPPCPTKSEKAAPAPAVNSTSSDGKADGKDASGTKPAEEAPTPSVPFPGNPPRDQPPASGFEWRGDGAVGSGRGNWYNPSTGESLWNDMESKDHEPHWDYRLQGKKGKWRWYADGRMEHQT